jgi:glycosyltransferase involved in cell wall biosynthesis
VKLVFLTQSFDESDAVLGFVPRWVAGLARRCERVRVIALSAGAVRDLPPNVDVRAVGRSGTLLRWWRYKAYLREALARDGFDTVLAHMVPRYSLLARGPARRHGARTFLWYTHAAVDARLERAVASVEKVFTASSGSLRVDTGKRVVTGHGIDLDHFQQRGEGTAQPARIVSVGRLTPSKDPLTILDALARLRASGHDVFLDLVGGGRTVQDVEYGRRIAERIEAHALAPYVNQPGEITYAEIPRWYERASVVVNASSTGSLDKVVLEAFATGRPAVSCNDAQAPLVEELGALGRELVFARGDAADLARRIEYWLALAPDERTRAGARLRALVARDHEVEQLCARLVREMGGAA